MKRKILALSIMGFSVAVSLFVLPVSAQAQEQKPQAYLMWDYMVKPGMTRQFEAGVTEEISLYAGIKFSIGWTTCTTEDFHYYFFIPVENFASIDSIYEALGEAETRLGESYKVLEKRMQETYKHCRVAVVYLRQDLSYTLPKQDIKPEESNYIFFEFTYVLPGKEEEFEAYCKESVAFCKKIGYPLGYATYQGDIGTEMPFYFWATAAKTQSDYLAKEEGVWKPLSQKEKEEAAAAYEKAFAGLQKYETKNGWSRPDLSYAPEAKMPLK